MWEEVLGRPVVYKGNLQENFVHGREKRPQQAGTGEGGGQPGSRQWLGKSSRGFKNLIQFFRQVELMSDYRADMKIMERQKIMEKTKKVYVLGSNGLGTTKAQLQQRENEVTQGETLEYLWNLQDMRDTGA